MPYVRSRTTKAGTPSTALVDAYRDKEGRPRQRLLASLHGEPTTLRALAKLAALRDDLRKERKKLALEAIDADRFQQPILSVPSATSEGPLMLTASMARLARALRSAGARAGSC